jgi:hypothetical protein
MADERDGQLHFSAAGGPDLIGRAVYFTVVTYNGREQAAKYWGELPRSPIRNLVYVLRLDQLPGGDKMALAPLDQLYRTFCAMRERGNLPPRWQPPPKPPAEKPTARMGHRENIIRAANTTPDDGFPTVAQLDARARERKADARNPPTKDRRTRRAATRRD